MPTVHLTDQASVAVHMAMALATDGRANVAHLVAGIAGEPEGMAGTLLRQWFGEAGARLAVHPAIGARSLPPLRTAYLALPVTDRPCWSLELLAAARRVGGEDLEFLLQECGVDLDPHADELVHRLPDQRAVEEHGEVAETYGRLGLLARGLSRDADLAVARARAADGDSRSLLRWLAVDEATLTALGSAPPVPLDAVVDRACRAGPDVRAADLVTAITHLSLRAALDR